ncbi:MAG: tetratricopeptide repeat protein [Deltaproteobacteria bacterium]|nr:tetratricopeptide repeat protein [Candidatus Zymogenaceae bacterium]
MIGCDGMVTEYIIDLFAASMKARSKSGVTWYTRGFEHMKSSEFEQAVYCYTRAVERDPQYKKAYFDRGNAYIYLSRFREAVSDFKEVVRMDPGDADAYYCLGFTYVLMDERDRARAGFRRACELGLERACIKLEGLGRVE